MVCVHLRTLETELLERGISVLFRGEAWSRGAREWVYFDCLLDLAGLRRRLQLDRCVVDHEHRGTHDGQERGFVCEEHHDAIMGLLELAAGTVTVS